MAPIVPHASQAARVVIAKLQRVVDAENMSQGGSTLTRETAPATTTDSSASHKKRKMSSGGDSSSNCRDEASQQQTSAKCAKTKRSAKAAQQPSTSEIPPAVPAESVRAGDLAVNSQKSAEGEEEEEKESPKEGGMRG